MSIEKICKNNVITISEKSSIQEAAKLMEERHVGCLLVLKDKDDESQKLIGIITDRDIVVKVVAKKTNLNGLTVEEAMSKDILMLPAEQDIKEAIANMCSKGVRRAPVVENKKVCGIVAVDDLMMRIADELSGLSDLVKHQASGRK